MRNALIKLTLVAAFGMFVALCCVCVLVAAPKKKPTKHLPNIEILDERLTRAEATIKRLEADNAAVLRAFKRLGERIDFQEFEDIIIPAGD